TATRASGTATSSSRPSAPRPCSPRTAASASPSTAGAGASSAAAPARSRASRPRSRPRACSPPPRSSRARAGRRGTSARPRPRRSASRRARARCSRRSSCSGSPRSSRSPAAPPPPRCSPRRCCSRTSSSRTATPRCSPPTLRWPGVADVPVSLPRARAEPARARAAERFLSRGRLAALVPVALFALTFDLAVVQDDGTVYFDFLARVLGDPTQARAVAYQFGSAFWTLPFYLASKLVALRGGFDGYHSAEVATTVAANAALLVCLYAGWRILRE